MALVKGTIDYLEETELFSLFRAIPNTRDYLVVRLLYELGCNLNELVSIRVRDIDTDAGTILIRRLHTRNSQDRHVRVSKKVISIIKGYTKENGLDEKRLSFLFQTARKTPLTPRRVFQIVEYCFQKAHLHKKASPQIIKYTHIVHAYRNRIPMEEIESHVGIRKQRLAQIFEKITVERTEDAYLAFFGKIDQIENGN